MSLSIGISGAGIGPTFNHLIARFAITGAKVYFIITSFGIQLALPRLLGDPRIFGQYGTENAVGVLFRY